MNQNLNGKCPFREEASREVENAIRKIFEEGFRGGESLRGEIVSITYYAHCIGCSEEKLGCINGCY